MSRRVEHPPDPAALVAFLDQHDRPCPRCDHNLRGVRDPRCPECGVPLRLELVTPQPSRRSFIVGVAALSSGFFFNATLILFLLWERFGAQSTPDLWRVGQPQIVSAAAFAVLLPWWVALARWMDQQSPAVRIVLAVSCWVLAFASAMWIHRVVR